MIICECCGNECLYERYIITIYMKPWVYFTLPSCGKKECVKYILRKFLADNNTPYFPE